MPATQSAHPLSITSDLAGLLDGGLQGLDITRAEFDLAERRYQDLGRVVDEVWDNTRGSNAYFTQGSFRIGTVVRNVNRNDDIDIDVVALKDVARDSITQEKLRQELRDAANRYSGRKVSGHPTVHECSRCVTLEWPGMHIDVLPAITSDIGSKDSILHSDKVLRNWLPSDPVGYSEWFRGQFSLSLSDLPDVLAKRDLEVEEIPSWSTNKSVLQRTVQVLKRHRDVYYRTRPGEQRVSSIIITTLAAMAFRGEVTLEGALERVLHRMQDGVEFIDGTPTVPNPVLPEENLADSWRKNDGSFQSAMRWLTAVRHDLGRLGSTDGIDEIIPIASEVFGERFASGVANHIAKNYSHAAANSGLLTVGNRGRIENKTNRSAASGLTVAANVFAGG